MNSTNEVYAAFEGHGFSSTLAIIIGIKVLLAFCGMLSNGSLVLVTSLNKNLHKPCNILIALNAFCSVLTMFNPWITFGVVLTGQNFIPLELCVYFQLIPMAASFYQYLLFLLIAIERLFAVLCPLWYSNSNTNTTKFLGLSIVGYSGYVFYSVFILSFGYSMKNADRAVMCSAPDAFDPILLTQVITINVVSVFCYIILCLFMICNYKGSTMYMHRILLSILVAFFLEFFGWLTNNGLRYVAILLSIDQIQSWYISQFSGYFLLIVLDMYAPVFYIFSTDYRKALLNTFGSLLCSNFPPAQVMNGQNQAWTA